MNVIRHDDEAADHPPVTREGICPRVDQNPCNALVGENWGAVLDAYSQVEQWGPCRVEESVKSSEVFACGQPGGLRWVFGSALGHIGYILYGDRRRSVYAGCPPLS